MTMEPRQSKIGLPDEGTAAWDAAVDAVMGQFHAPEVYAERVVNAVLEAIKEASCATS